MKQTFPEVPLMLDESVVIENDIWKAKEIGVEFIKSKLFKQERRLEIIEQTQLIYLLGMKAVFGIGVASSLSNGIENTIYKQYSQYSFGESVANGYLKLR